PFNTSAPAFRSNRKCALVHFIMAYPEKLVGLFRTMCSAPGRCAGETSSKHNSKLISSLVVVADVTDDVGDVLIALFLVGDEGRIVVIVIFDGFVDLDIVFRLGNHGLD